MLKLKTTIFLMLMVLLMASGCFFQKDKVEVKGVSAAAMKGGQAAIDITNIRIINHQLVIDGNKLGTVVSINLSGPSGFNENFDIESKTAEKIVANGTRNIPILAQGTFILKMTDFFGTTTHSLNFVPQDGSVTGLKIHHLGASNGQVLSYNATSHAWEPRTINGLEFRGSWDPNTDCMDPSQGAGPNTGDYWIVSTANSSCNLTTDTQWAIGDWAIYDGSAWHKIKGSNEVISFNGRKGAVVPMDGDYNLDDMGDVDLTGLASGHSLQWDGTSWVVFNPTATGSVDSSMIQDGSIQDIDIANVAMGKVTGLSALLAAKENTITAGTNLQYWRGDKSWQTLNTATVVEGATNLYFTQARAIASPLTGFNPPVITSSVAATDSVLGAIEKLYARTNLDFIRHDGSIAMTQDFNLGGNDIVNGGTYNGVNITTLASSVATNAATIATHTTQIAGKEGTITAGTAGQYWHGDKTWHNLGNDVRALPLTGMVLTDATDAVATDSFVVAMGKFQRQINNITAVGGDITAVVAGSGLTGGATSGSATVGINTGGVTSTHIFDSAIMDADIAAGAAISQSKISGLATSLAAKEDSITAGTTAQYWRGDKSWQDFGTDSRGSLLTGLSTNNAAVVATDSVLDGFGKVQGQLNNKEASITAGTTAQYWRGDKSMQTLNTTVTPEGTNLYFTQARTASSVLSTYAVGSNAVLANTDTVVGAFGKLQAELNAISAVGGDITAVNTNAGSALTGGVVSGNATLQVVVDNVGVEIATNTLRLKDGGVTSTKILDGTIAAADLNQMSANPNEVLKWNGTNWAPAADADAWTAFAAGTTAQYMRGDKTWQTLNTTAVPEGTNLYFTEARTRASVLTGLSLADGTDVVATDSTLVAFGKLQKQLDDMALSGGGDITSVVAGSGLTGGATSGSATVGIATGGVTSTHIADGTIVAQDINQMSATSGQLLKWNGTAWAPAADVNSGGDLTDVVAGTGISVTNSSGPNPTVALAAQGISNTLLAGISVNCTLGQVLKTNGLGSFYCGTDNTNTGDITDVVAGSGISVTNSSGPNPTVDIATGGVTSTHIPDAAVAAADLNQMGATSGQVLKWNGSAWTTSADADGWASLTAGTTAQYLRGDKSLQTLNTTAVPEGTNLYFTEARARAALLTGLSLADGTDVVATDTALVATGKIQKQLDDVGPSVGDISAVNTNAGSALSGGVASGDASLQVVVDNSTLEITSNAIGIKDAGVTAAKLNQMGASPTQILKWNGSAWAPAADNNAGGDLTEITAGNGITITNGTGPIPTVALTNQGLVNTNFSGINSNCAAGRVVKMSGTWICGTDSTASGMLTDIVAGSSAFDITNSSGPNPTIALANDGIATAHIAGGAIGAADMANNIVTSAKIIDGYVNAAELASDSITSAKIATGAVMPVDYNDVYQNIFHVTTSGGNYYCDGVLATHAQNAISTCGNKANTAGGGIVKIHAGTYPMTLGLSANYTKPVTFKGDGIGKTILQATTTDIIYISSSDLAFEDFSIDFSAITSANIYGIITGSTTAYKNIRIERIKISAPGTFAGAVYGIRFQGTPGNRHENVIIRNCIVDTNELNGNLTTGGAITISGAGSVVKNLVITNNYFRSYLSAIGNINGGNTANPFENVEISNNIWYAAGASNSISLYLSNLKNAIFKNNIFLGVTNTSSSAYLTSSNLGNSDNVIVSDNIFNTNGTQPGFNATTGSNVVYHNNTNRGSTDPAKVHAFTGTSLLSSSSYGDVVVRGEASPTANNTYSSGSSTNLWTAVYATNGTIQTSDGRYKTDIENSDLGLDFVTKLRPVKYHFKDAEQDEMHYGFLAQEVEELLMGKSFFGLQYSEEADKYSLSYTEFVSPMVKALQELHVALKKNLEMAAIMRNGLRHEVENNTRLIASVERRAQELKESNALLIEENKLMQEYLCAKDPSAPFCE